ncbi:YrrS family protein (plasmid) [Bacillus sp. 31A1R]|uniref:YrrS family protein n=1 Tax=Robertmurraya mangrovi TaxID=3098077 RepID=A0ABU5IUR2_9BACI|nr:YrrS family protein [Bacillus sp. 31A1R]MDZ5470891.1 YrrS family protein [Bacillus sp. 31A1R]
MKSGYGQSRFDQRTKKRKVNLVLNTLIGIVLLLIIVVSANIFLGDNEAADESKKNVETKEATKESNSSDNSGSVVEEEEESTEETAGEETDTQADSSETEETESVEGEEVVTEGGSDPNVLRTIVNPAWKPVGTVQTGEHVTQFGGVDWDEMVQAITYGTGLSEDNMTILFLGNNGHNKAIGTVYPKDKSQFFRVSIEWVDGEGWKPTMVEELAEPKQ